jgi:putative toxin-antitoxin system antitoxin component (TIGR02293 family)
MTSRILGTPAQPAPAGNAAPAAAPRDDQWAYAHLLATRFDDLLLGEFDSAAHAHAHHLFHFDEGGSDAFTGGIFNRNLAAKLASRPIRAAAVKDWFKATGVEPRKHLFAALNVHPSTLSRAKADTALDPAVTERVLRHSDLLVRAAEVFGTEGKAWMTKPHDQLDGKSPLEYSSNEFGADKVRAMLIAIEYGGVV